MDKISNGSISPIPFFVGSDTSYNASNPITFGIQSWIGPMEGGTYSNTGETTARRLAVTGDLTITGTGPGAVLGGTLSIGAGSHTIGCTQADACTESWTSIDHTLVSAPMTIATSNSAGGYDYQLTTYGAPDPLQPCIGYFPYFCNSRGPVSNFAGQVFPSVTPSIPYAGSAWPNPPPILGFASNEGGLGQFTPPNLGTTTTATLSGYSCVPVSGNPADCGAGALVGTTTPVSTPGIENLQGKISTNAAGMILVAKFSVSHEFDTLAGFPAFSHPDSFNGNYITVSGISAIGQNDVQIDKKNNFNVVIEGSNGFDVSSIPVESLQFGPGLYALPPNGPTLGSETHQKTHISGGDMTAHFASNASDLECGVGQVKLRGTSDGVPIVLSVRVNGVGKACRPNGDGQ
jgi:hypothetical protein